MATFAIVHNIPSPYRLHLFKSLERELSKRGHDLEVHFFAHGHQDRPESWKNPEIPFNHRFWRDYGFTVKGVALHFNPGLIRHLLSRRFDYVLVGGAWDTPTGFLTSVLVRWGVKIAWIEGNTATPGRITGLLGFYKRFILTCYKYIAVPGVEGAKYVKLLNGRQSSQHADTLILPNLVDESMFTPKATHVSDHKKVYMKKLGINYDKKLAVWPARLIQVKGVIEFINNISPDLLKNWNIIIIGEGALKDEIVNVVNLKNLSDCITVRRHIEYQEMPLLYSAADLFILASLSDPNPLSVVEAMHSGLPLLISKNVGNFPEALEQGVNGWGFDPYSPDSVVSAAEQAFSSSAEKLAEMGHQSKERAKKTWGTEKAISTFLDGVLK